MNKPSTPLQVPGIALLSLFLAACGGGSGSSDVSSPAPAPAPTPASSPSQAPAPAPAPSPATGSWWTPTTSTTWQWQLTGTLDTSVDAAVYDIDLVDTSAATIAALKAAGHKVVCYFSAGSAENWRPDYAQFAAADMGNPLDGWAGERWLDTRSANVRAVMAARLALAQSKGCDGVEPDNVDGYANTTGFPLAASDQIDYNRYLATGAHALGLAVALKNDVAQLEALQPSFDFAVNEQCHEFSECGGYAVFTSQGKPVFNAEYKSAYVNNTSGARDALCVAAKSADLRTLVLPLALDGSFRYSCG